MSQSTTFYRITESSFQSISDSDGINFNPIKESKEYCTLERSFMGIEYVLSKAVEPENISLIHEIFQPANCIGGYDLSEYDIDKIDPTQLESLVMNDSSIYYLTSDQVKEAHAVLSSLKESVIQNNYEPEEMNRKGIYPGVWHRDNSQDQAFNERDIIEGFWDLKTFFERASAENDYVLCYIG